MSRTSCHSNLLCFCHSLICALILAIAELFLLSLRFKHVTDSTLLVFMILYSSRQSLNIGCMDCGCSFCGALHWLGERQSGSSKLNPKFHSCCKSNAVRLPLIKDPPVELRELFTSTNQEAIQFCKHIRHYNGAFAFASAMYNTNNRVFTDSW